MICDAVARIFVSLTCEATPLASDLGGWSAVLVALISGIWALLRGRSTIERLGAAAAAISAIGLGFAAGLPALRSAAPEVTGGRVVALLDVSESVRRDGWATYNASLGALADRIDAVIGTEADTDGWSGSVVRFAGRAERIAGPIKLGQLADATKSANLGPADTATDLAAGLEAALSDIEAASGGGSVWLLSDGWPTGDGPDAAIRQAQAMGVPIHVFGTGSQAASKGLLSSNLGPEHWVGEEAIVRLTVMGSGNLEWSANGSVGQALSIADAAAPQAVRLPATFAERGLGHVSLAFRSGPDAVQANTLFTLVKGPARILAFGGARWLSALPEQDYWIERRDPAQKVDLAPYDVIVVDGVSPDAFPAGFPQALLNRAAGGAGLLIVNGGRRGTEEDDQNIALWEATVLGPILPVASDPEKFLAEPPRRDVLIVFDTSGSMGQGTGRLSFAKQIAMRIANALRPQDTLTILPFSTDPAVPFKSNGVTDAERARARAFLNRLVASGGTGIGNALTKAGGLTGNYCAAFIIGDGEYDPGMITNRPLCETVTIGVAGSKLPGIDTRNGQALVFRPGQSIGKLRFAFFEPEERIRFWRKGPLSVQPGGEDQVYDGLPPVGGVALAYLRPEADAKVLIRDPPPDPVLAFRRDPEQRHLQTAVFLSEVPRGWEGSAQGRRAIADMIGTLISWRDPNRFDIRLENSGELFSLRVTAVGDAPPPGRLSAAFQADGRAPVGFNLQRRSVEGEFEGSAKIALGDDITRGILELQAGSEATQIIPMILPARGQANAVAGGLTSETLSAGVNELLLEHIRVSTGGKDLRTTGPVAISASTLPDRVTPIWPIVAAVSALGFSISLFGGGMRR